MLDSLASLQDGGLFRTRARAFRGAQPQQLHQSVHPPHIVLQLLPGDVEADNFLIRDGGHGSRVLGSDGHDEAVHVRAVVGQHCPRYSRLERGILAVSLCPYGCVKPVDPVEDVQTHGHPVVHPGLEHSLQRCPALCTATPAVHVQDLGHRLIGQPEPLHHSVAHGCQLGSGLLAGEHKGKYLGVIVGDAGEPLGRAFALPR